MKRRHSQTEILAELQWAHRSRRGTLEGREGAARQIRGGGRTQRMPPPFTGLRSGCAHVCVLET